MRAFQQLLRGAQQSEIIIPVLRAALYAPSFTSFDVPMKAFHERVFDGFFHPSAHPLWPERMLYYYLMSGADFENVTMDDLGTMAVTSGNYWHSFIGRVLLDAQAIRNNGSGASSVFEQIEFYVEDKSTLSRGWMDGVLNPDKLAIEVPEGLEIKTMNQRKFSGCPKGPPQSTEKINWLKEKNPAYYGQAQEYLRMSGMSTQRFLIIDVSYPFAMLEIAVPFDPGYSANVVNKYRRVIQAVADNELPIACCGVGSKAAKVCPARLLCPVGRMSV